jgi:hypothetical protein
MITRVIGFITLLAAASVATANSLDFSLNDETVRLVYAHDLETATKGLSIEGGWLYTSEIEVDGTKVDDSENLFHLGLMVSGENWSEKGSFDISVGGRLAYTSPDDDDLLSLALGGDVRFSPIERVGFSGNVFYSPKILSFMDSEGYIEYGLRVDYQLLPQAFVYMGYRKLEFDVEDGPTVEYDNSFNIGLKMMF